MRIITSILLSGLVLLTSMSFGVNFHYCQGKVKSFALFSEAKACDHKTVAACPMHQTMQDERDCCDDESKIVQGQEHQIAIAKDVVKDLAPVAFEAPVFENVILLSFENATPHKFQNLKPPLIGKHLRVLVQSFLC